jgi:hypothetical protein
MTDRLDMVSHRQLEDGGLVEVPMFIPPPFEERNISHLRPATALD